MDDGDIVRALASGELASPHRFINSWYFRIRISGVGLSFRPSLKEHVWRQPALYLTKEFLDRASGLPVVWLHPEAQVLDSPEFAKRIVGTVIRAYIASKDGVEDVENGDEVWGIARILDDDAAKQMREKRLSTSPAVLLEPGESERQELKGDEHLLVEGGVRLLDHVAIVESGVWDKGKEPSGIDNGAPAGNGRKDEAGVPGEQHSEDKMEEDKEKEHEEKEKEQESKEDARDDAIKGEHLDKLLKGIDGLHKRMDAFEAEMNRRRRRDDDDDDRRKRDDARRKRDDEDKDLEESQAKRLEQLAEEEREEGDKKDKKKDSRSDRSRDDDDDDRKRDDRRARDDESEEDKNKDEDEDKDDRKDRRRARDDDDDDDDEHRDDVRLRPGMKTPPPRERPTKSGWTPKASRDDDDDDDRHRDDARDDARGDAAVIAGLREQIESQGLQMAQLMQALNRPFDERAKFTAAQAKADSVYQMHGIQGGAPPSLTGETETAYRLRLVKEMQKHSPTWKDTNLGNLATADAVAFGNAEAAIYADAATAARAGTSVPGHLRSERIVDPDSGVRIRKWYGDPNVWMNNFKSPLQYATKVGGEKRS